MNNTQAGILSEVPRAARYMTFSMTADGSPAEALRTLKGMVDGRRCVLGIGASLAAALGAEIAGLKTFRARDAAGITVPSTPAALWLWLRGDDPGELFHLGRSFQATLEPVFTLGQAIDAFQYGDSRDLTGYEDGTENPKDGKAVEAAIVTGQGEGMDGSSLVAVQQWLHDLDRFQSMPRERQDHTIGRRLSDNGEIEEAPASAHVKRTAQEDFEPDAFVLRRSMPWAADEQGGLVFVAFGRSFDAFEALLQRMLGEDDGITDALFTFTRPVTGGYFWCPPTKDGKLDLRALGL